MTGLLEQVVSANTRQAESATALHAATLRGDAALLAGGADPNTPLVRGSPGRRNSSDYVLEHDVVGTTVFWRATRFAGPGALRALADGDADPRTAMADARPRTTGSC